MAEVKKLEREYIIPLRKEWLKKPRYKRTRQSVIAVKKFIARHMKVSDRNLDNVKIDRYLNNELWFRGCKKPHSKIKVIAKKEGEIVNVELADMPDKWKFQKIKDEKRHKKVEKKSKVEKKVEEKKETEKKEESEKEKSVAISNEKQAKQIAKAQKHTPKVKTQGIQRKSLKK